MRQAAYANNQHLLKRNRQKAVSTLQWGLFWAIMVISNPVSAFSAEDPWAFSLGAGAYATSVYYGSDETYVVPIPNARGTYTRGPFSASLSLLEGIGMMYTNKENHFWASINCNSGSERDPEGYNALGMSRDHGDDVKKLLAGSPTVKTTVRTQMMIGYLSRLANFGFSLEYHPTTVEGDDNRSYNGFIASLSCSKPFHVSEKMTITAMVDLSVMEQNYAEAWFAVENPTQSLAAFDANAGLRDLQLIFQIDYMISPRFGITFQNGNSVLLMDAADSPYTTSKYQMTSALYGFYNF